MLGKWVKWLKWGQWLDSSWIEGLLALTLTGRVWDKARRAWVSRVIRTIEWAVHGSGGGRVRLGRGEVIRGTDREGH